MDLLNDFMFTTPYWIGAGVIFIIGFVAHTIWLKKGHKGNFFWGAEEDLLVIALPILLLITCSCIWLPIIMIVIPSLIVFGLLALLFYIYIKFLNWEKK